MTLQAFFKEHPNIALAFSGGVDSSYLLYAAKQYGARVKAYYVNAAFQPQFELDDATRLAKELEADLEILTVDVLANRTVTANPANRCYYCKQVIFQTILEAAKNDGFHVLMDGTNASDDASDRPGMKALEELEVISPLRMVGMTKDDVRQASKEAGLFTWDKPSYACLATRIPTGEAITQEKLSATEAAEDFLFSLGFTDFRVRMMGGNAKIQVPEGQMEALLAHRKAIVERLKDDYSSVLLDLEARP